MRPDCSPAMMIICSAPGTQVAMPSDNMPPFCTARRQSESTIASASLGLRLSCEARISSSSSTFNSGKPFDNILLILR